MNLPRMLEQVQTIRTVINKVRANKAYIATAVEHGCLNPKLSAICIGHAENWEALSHGFSDLQAEVDALGEIITRMVKPMDNGEHILISLDGMRVLRTIDMQPVLDVGLDEPGLPVHIFGVFEISPDLKFAI